MATQQQIEKVRKSHAELKHYPYFGKTPWIFEAPWGLGVRFYPDGEGHEGMVDTLEDGDVVLITKI